MARYERRVRAFLNSVKNYRKKLANNIVLWKCSLVASRGVTIMKTILENILVLFAAALFAMAFLVACISLTA